MIGRRWLIPLVPVAGIGLLSLYWHWTVVELEAGYVNWAQASRAAGWTIQTGPPLRGGWPFTATLRVPEPAIAIDDPNGLANGLFWQAEQLVLRVALLQPTRLRIEAEGKQSLRLGAGPAIPFTADRLRVEWPLSANAATLRADLTVHDLRATLPWRGDTVPMPVSLTLGELRLHLDLQPEASAGRTFFGFSLSAAAVGLPPEMASPLGPMIAAVALEGGIDGSWPDSSQSADRDIATRAARWRDDGGKLELSRAAIAWGNFDLSGTATLSLDGGLQPIGAGTAHIAGYGDALDALVMFGWLAEQPSTLAKVILTQMSRPSANAAPGAAMVAEIPVILQNRVLSVHQIKLLRMPALAWPTP